jgi:hypothetical protein
MTSLNLTLLDLLSKIGTFLVLFSLLFFVLKYTLCRIFKLHKRTIYNIVYFDDAFSIVFSIIIILNFFTILSPYK